MPTIRLTSGTAFPADEQQTLLDAALAADITLDHSCRSGRCSSCKARQVSGITEALHEETGLSSAEREQGWILTCVRRAVNDVEIEADVLDGVRLPAARNFPAKVQSIQRLADDVVAVALRLPPGQVLQYFAGQYIDVTRRDDVRNEGVRRSYSLANAPRADHQVELHVRQVPGGEMSRYWFDDIKPNDLLQLRGPMGAFFLRGIAGKSLVMLATGTGIAPVKAMLESVTRLTPADAPRSLMLLWGGREPADLYWDPCSLDFGNAGVALQYVPVLSRADTNWGGERGYVQEVLLRQCQDFSDTVVYACGSDAMINGARKALLAAGLDHRQFHSDAFLCSAPV